MPGQVGDRVVEVVQRDRGQPGPGARGKVRALAAGLLQEVPPGLLEHRVVDRVLGSEVRVQRGLLHADPHGDVAQGQAGHAALVGRVPGRLEDLPPGCLTTFGLPIAFRRNYHR